MNILIRIPNWLGDIIMAWPIIKGIQNAHPNAQIHLLGLPAFASLIKVLDDSITFHALPKKNLSYYYKVLRKHRGKYDIELVLTNSERGDIEAWLINAPKRIGVQQGSKRRSMLNQTYELNTKISLSGLHQSKVWEQMAQSFGLLENMDTQPVKTHTVHTINTDTNTQAHVIGLICGSENSPEKRWPVSHWRELIKKLLKHHSEQKILLFGTIGDKDICQQVAAEFDTHNVINRAGKTNLQEFSQELLSCHNVIANDTGGMHLANALGVKVFALYGPTNPVSSGAVFANAQIIQPDKCPATGPMDIALITPEQVFSVLTKEA